ncbi:MAG: HAD-IIIA family hydrolase [Euryarchaeota archaeon TMED85]|nr:MAG: hypothetical protein CMA04_001415 [Euryarchaeota archaeon]RPG74060.1 MAG: HAD-IIIA family hydrolase [Euryarchaeota archaeon TMED85]
MYPHRHRSQLLDSLQLQPLPSHVQWSGKIAYLDRDGVLNVGSKYYVNDTDEVVILPEAGRCVGQLRRAGFRICICTNQSPIDRGWWDHTRLAKIHDYIQDKLFEEDEDALLDLILYSPYHPVTNSFARKGNPGMLQAGRQILEAAHNNLILNESNFNYAEQYIAFDESQSVMVGDRMVDMEAASNHSVHGIHVNGKIGILDAIEEILRGNT